MRIPMRSDSRSDLLRTAIPIYSDTDCRFRTVHSSTVNLHYSTGRYPQLHLQVRNCRQLKLSQIPICNMQSRQVEKLPPPKHKPKRKQIMPTLDFFLESENVKRPAK